MSDHKEKRKCCHYFNKYALLKRLVADLNTKMHLSVDLKGIGDLSYVNLSIQETQLVLMNMKGKKRMKISMKKLKISLKKVKMIMKPLKIKMTRMMMTLKMTLK